MPHFVLEISFDSRLEETVAGRLFLTRSLGSTFREAGGRTTLEAYFDSAAARNEAMEACSGVAVELRVLDREPVDWLAVYQQSLQPIEIGERFLVAPDSALLPPGVERLQIVVPQEQAFGTGSHETTALCMSILETMNVENQNGLDIGAGSGILAMAMYRLGCPRVIAFDNDPDAFGALRDNRARNGIPAEAMPLFIGGLDALRGGAFEIVTMNIIPEVIIPLLGGVRQRMRVGAKLIVSGVLIERRDEVITAAAAHALELQSERQRGEWWAGLFQRLR